MNQSQLTTLLERITGHFAATTPEQERMLAQAQSSIASSLMQSDDTGSEQLFANSDFYAREKINPKNLDTIAALAKQTVQQTSDPGFRAFVRSVPVRNAQVNGSVPDWAMGAKPSETIGPLLNNEGREIWIDIYKVVKLVTLYMGTQPILLFKVSTISRIPVATQAPLATSYTIIAGSVWINAQFLSASAPVNRFVGLKVKGGTIKLSILPTAVNGKITLNPQTNIELSLQPEQGVDDGAALDSQYGTDARQSKYNFPVQWTISWIGATKKVSSMTIGPAACVMYGQEMKFNYKTIPNPPVIYSEMLNAVLIPWQADVPDFNILSCKSPFVTISETAKILNTYWSLPAATLDLLSPVEAEGNGGVIIECGPGLRAVWTNLQNEDARLTKPLIAGAPGGIFVLDLSANTSGATQHFDLWKDSLHPYRSSTDLSFLKNAPFLFTTSSEKAQEFITTQCNSDFKTDRPVKVNGESFEIRSTASLLMLGASDARRLVYLYDDNMIADYQAKNPNQPAPKPVAIALENAVFTVSRVNACMLFGECNESWQKVTKANLFLAFALYRYLPTLPDPYIGNLRTWDRLFGKREQAATVAQVASNPFTMLLCAVQFGEVDTETDDVKVGFYFGAFPASTATTNPSAANPAVGVPVANPTRGTTIAARVVSARSIGGFKNSFKITTASIEKQVADNNAFLGATMLNNGPIAIAANDSVALTTTASSDVLKQLIKEIDRGHAYGDLWENALIGSRINAEPFALLDVSSNANQMGVSVSGQMIIVKTASVTAVGANQAAVSTTNTGFPFIVDGMEVKAPGSMVRSFALPIISWEPVFNLTEPDRDNPLDLTSPKLPMDPERGYLYFEDDGGPTRIWNNNPKPVSLAPIAVINSLLEEFKSNPQNYTVSSFTLPFGLKAISYISKNFVEPVGKKPDITNVRPLFRKNDDGTYRLEGGIQLSLKSGTFGKVFPEPEDNDTPMFPGYVVQFNNLVNVAGQQTSTSNLGHRVTEIFNNEFLTGVLSLSTDLKKSRGVPLSRMDITGYGANIFSDWISPSAAMAQTSQAKFEVMMGRTAHEVIQVKSILIPWGIKVVRTITLFRTSTGYIYRTDSGWKPESDGKFDFSYRYKIKTAGQFSTNPGDFITELEPYEFHPGVIKGLFNVRNIKDAPSVQEYISVNDIPNNTDYLNGIKGQVYTNTSGGTLHEPVKCGGVYFDADIEIENVVQGHQDHRVVSKKILGYVQVAPAGKPLTAFQLRDLLSLQNNSIGGDIDCVVDINNSDQQMRLNRFDVNASVNAGGNPVFVVAARGNVFLPKDGSWAMVQHNAGTGDVIPLPEGVTVPLIRTGKWKKGVVVDPAVVASQLLRIAHPLEILRVPGAATINFGYLQNTATQKALFLTPAYGQGKKMLLSKTPPIFADAYRMMTGSSIFPNIGNAIDNFGKAMPLLTGKDSLGNAATAFVTNTLANGEKVLELMEVKAEKVGEAVVRQGMSMLQKGANGLLDKALKFDVPPFEIPLVDTKALRIYIEYKTGKNTDTPANYTDSKLNFDVDSFAGDMGKQWKSRLNNLAMVVDLGDMKRLMTIKGNFDGNKGKETGYEGGDDSGLNGLPVPEIEFSDALKPVLEILTILAQLSAGNYAAAMKKGLKIAMSNSGEVWEYKFEASKEIPLVRFPPTDELYNSAQTPLKLECSLGVGVYFNAALKVTTDPGQLLPTAGAFLKFHGGLSVMCLSVGVGSIYAIGSVDVKIACDTKVGPNLTMAFGFGVQIVVSLPVVGHASVTYMIGVVMYVDKTKVIITAMMLFRGNAELLGGLVCVTITIEAKGIVEKSGDKTEASAQVTFAIDISIFLIIDISFSKTWGEDRQIA